MPPTLTTIKLIHTAAWAFFVACILSLPISAALNRMDWALTATLFVLIECSILAFNKCACPLTAIAARYTTDRAENFDIYLPRVIARKNKTIFGTLFIVGEICVLLRWLA